ncbi:MULTISPECIES: hypothetical protein [Actinoplanes]|uniref:hypothetical protein n=1 Tax=Actinoplanes TaxID=1865 RepID=UPI000B1D2A7F|nr:MULTISPECIES: hypothetical protein [Actinoplanes]GLY00671.1 hypothetical protein Acsp01_10500 [Actinoplanes sp. NBRC 101535]
MDQTAVAAFVQAHLDALQRGDIDVVTEDFAAPLRPHLPGIVASLPMPFASAENVSIEVEPEQAVVVNRLTGENGVVITMRSVWTEVGGRPRIIDGAPV